MTTKPEDIVAEIMDTCKALVSFAVAAQPGTSAYDAECHVFKHVIGVGAKVVGLFLNSQADHYRRSSATMPDGEVLGKAGERTGTYYSIFGEIPFRRTYFAGGGKGYYPLDAALNLPLKGASDFRRKMEARLSIDLGFLDASKFVGEYFPVPTSSSAVQEIILSDSADVEDYYKQAAIPAPLPKANVLVVQADGKGVPIVPRQRAASLDQAACPCPTPGAPKGPRVREGKTKEVTLVSVSMHVPFVRTPEQVWESLFRAADDKEPRYSDPYESAAFKRVWGSLESKAAAFKQATVWTDELERVANVQNRVRLTDGQVGLQKAAAKALPDYAAVLDLIHALQKLWKGAALKFGSKGKEAGEKWVRDRALTMLQGKSKDIVAEIDVWLTDMQDGEDKVQLGNIANYLEANLNAMKYNEYLAAGWPIASGMIEGACRHVVKDRLERSGMRWTIEGATAFLKLRCAHINGDWEAYTVFRMKQRSKNTYKIPSVSKSTVYQFNTADQKALAI